MGGGEGEGEEGACFGVGLSIEVLHYNIKY